MEIEAIGAESVGGSFQAGRGPAIVAVAASILTAIYHMIEDGTTYQGLGGNHFERRCADRQKTRWSNVWRTSATRSSASPSPPEPRICYHPRVCGMLRSGSFLCRFFRPIDPMAIGVMFC